MAQQSSRNEYGFLSILVGDIMQFLPKQKLLCNYSSLLKTFSKVVVSSTQTHPKGGTY